MCCSCSCAHRRLEPIPQPPVPCAGPSCEPRKARGAPRTGCQYASDEQRRAATQIGPAHRSNYRLRRQAAISGVAPPRRTTGVRGRRRALELAAWRRNAGYARFWDALLEEYKRASGVYPDTIDRALPAKPRLPRLLATAKHPFYVSNGSRFQFRFDPPGSNLVDLPTSILVIPLNGTLMACGL